MVVTDEKIGQRLWQDMKAQVLGMAKQAGPGPGQKPLTPEEELLMWNTEADGWTPDKEMALLASGKSRTAVGLMKYLHRQKMAEQGERYFDKYAQAKYMADMARRADPTWTLPVPQAAQEPSLAPPTDPLAPPEHPLVSGPPPLPDPMTAPLSYGG